MGAFSASLSAREPARASTPSRCLNSMVRTQDSCHSSSSPADSNGNMYKNGAVALHLHPTFLAEQPASWTVITCKPLDNPATCTWPSELSNTPSVLSSSSTSTPCPAGNGSPLDAKTENSISGACSCPRVRTRQDASLRLVAIKRACANTITITASSTTEPEAGRRIETSTPGKHPLLAKSSSCAKPVPDSAKITDTAAGHGCDRRIASLGVTLARGKFLLPIQLIMQGLWRRKSAAPLGAFAWWFAIVRSCDPARALHPRNAFQGSYDFSRLCSMSPALRRHVIAGAASKGGRDTIDFADAAAVRALNAALLKADYGIAEWRLPEGKLCPPVPGRADYVHHLADALCDSAGGGPVPQGRQVVGLDIGTGASVIYPLLGSASYGWRFIGTESDPESFASARSIAAANAALDIDVRFQSSTPRILSGMLGDDETVDFVMCNPPFFGSPDEFAAASTRKQANLRLNARKRGSSRRPPSRRAWQGRGRSGGSGAARNDERPTSNNFAGGASELWCPGGEVAFVSDMALESQAYASRSLWFTSLVSRSENLKTIRQRLTRIEGIQSCRTIPMAQGQKASNILLWTFLKPGMHSQWARQRGWAHATRGL